MFYTVYGGRHCTRQLHQKPPTFLPPRQESAAHTRMPNVGIDFFSKARKSNLVPDPVSGLTLLTTYSQQGWLHLKIVSLYLGHWLKTFRTEITIARGTRNSAAEPWVISSIQCAPARHCKQLGCSLDIGCCGNNNWTIFSEKFCVERIRGQLSKHNESYIIWSRITCRLQ